MNDEEEQKKKCIQYTSIYKQEFVVIRQQHTLKTNITQV